MKLLTVATPHGPRRTSRPSGKLKDATYVVLGDPYDRLPCPHSIIRWHSIPDPQRPDDPTRMRARRTELRCERPGVHIADADVDYRLHRSGSGDRW